MMKVFPNLIKFIAQSGTASRRAAQLLVERGEIWVNGVVETNPARRITAEDEVMYQGRQLKAITEFHYILLNKPRGYVCSSCDFHAEKLAIDLINLPGTRLVSAGRLDKESEGAIIFSDDGDYIAKLTHPSFGVLKEYIVTVSKSFTPAVLKKMVSGVEDNGEFLHVEKITPLGNNRYRIVLNEGRKREIRRLTAWGGAETLELRRVAIGKLKLGTLPLGEWKELTPLERAMALCEEDL